MVGNLPVLISECKDDRCNLVAAQVGLNSLLSLPHTQSSMLSKWSTNVALISSETTVLPRPPLTLTLSALALALASPLTSIFLQNRRAHLWPFIVLKL